MSTNDAMKWRRRAVFTWSALAAAALLAVATVFIMAATDDTDNIALSRNEVNRTTTGERAWSGSFWNDTDSVYTDLETVVLFLDDRGRPVGQAVGGAKRLNPSEHFDLEARLPQSAEKMQIYQMRWSLPSGVHAVLGPYHAWPFGYTMRKPG